MVGIWAQRMKLIFIFIDLLGDSLGPSCTNKTYGGGILGLSHPSLVVPSTLPCTINLIKYQRNVTYGRER